MNDELLFTNQPARSRTITIEDQYWELARQLGHGNASKGIRAAIYQATTGNSRNTETTASTKNTTK
jgi:hypothetical protein